MFTKLSILVVVIMNIIPLIYVSSNENIKYCKGAFIFVVGKWS